MENRDDLRAFASQFGEELTDEDFDRLRESEVTEAESEDADTEDEISDENDENDESTEVAADVEEVDDDPEATDRS